MSHVTFGFAAGCAAEAPPRRRDNFHNLGYALGTASGRVKSEGLSPNQGQSPETI